MNVTSAKLEALADDYKIAILKRDEIEKKIKEKKADLSEAFRVGKGDRATLEIAQLEGELAVIKSFLITNLEDQEQAREEAIRQGIEDGHAVLDNAEAEQERLLRAIDSIVPILEKNGRALLELRTKTLESVSNIITVDTDRAVRFMQRKERIGTPGWDVKRFLIQYLTFRGKRHFNDPIPKWGQEG